MQAPTVRRAIAARVACGLTAACAVAGLVLAIMEPDAAAEGDAVSGVPVAVLEALVLTTLGLLGAVVASRQPGNAVGWLLTLIALALGCLALSAHVHQYVLETTGEVKGIGIWAAWVNGWVWIPAITTAFTIFPLLYPTGGPVSPRWRWLVWTAVVAQVVTFVGSAFVEGPLDSYPDVTNPVGVGGAAFSALAAVGFLVLVPIAFASIASLVVRYRRAGGAERQQIKWVAAAAALVPIAFSGAGLEGDAGYPLLLVVLLLIGTAVAVAMLRYRLYDIDVVINRALVYGALTATLALTYIAGVLLLQLVLRSVTADSGLAIAVSTLAVAAIFQPARRRIQATVDRRFYRRKYDAARTLERFGARLRDEIDLDTLGSELRGVVAQTMQPTHVSLWLRPPPPR